MDKTKKIEKIVDLEIPKDLKEKEGENAEYGHGKSINEIKKYNNTIISTSCYEKDNKFFYASGIKNNILLYSHKNT